ncbi:hypothetical protein [Staphylococcus epidermidis]|uniref:hypothetical protein n=1 Tax=Staphylococcus epidermidis TaxID=1282 RepID=UPI0034D641BB
MNNLKDKVLEFIRENGSTYIYELKPLFDEAGIPFEGDRSLTFDGDKNKVFFYHCTTESGSVVQELYQENKISIVHNPRYVMRYLLDGKVPPLPLSITNDELDKPSWIPVVLRIKVKEQTK